MLYEEEKVIGEELTGFELKKKLQNVVLAALIGETNLKESAVELIEHYGVQSDTVPTLIQIARDAQMLTMSIENSEISDELRDNRVRSLLKKIVLIPDESRIPTPEVFTLGE